MQYREFGKTGVSLSTLGFGAMRLPQDEDEAVHIIHRSLELGLNYLDTALIYGESERVCAKALKGWRDRVYVSTKNPLNDDTVEGWWQRLNQSLERLDIDCIDFYQVVHGLNWDAYNNFLMNGGGMEAVRKAQEQGLIKYTCFSCHDSPENMVKLIDTGEFAGMTLQYNLLDRANEDVISHAHQSGMGVIVMGPVAGGRLMGPSSYLRDAMPADNSTRAELALRFVLSNPGVTCAISGMSDMAQVEQNCAVAGRDDAMSDEERQSASDALRELKRLTDLYCTGCNYCMPCPSGVNIPANFHNMNVHRVFGLTEQAKAGYNSLSSTENPEWGKKASECIECGQCEPKCPQKIEIIRQLKEVVEALG
ncbi:MAG: aldo/keto reductase [Armatimonadota bacterium]